MRRASVGLLLACWAAPTAAQQADSARPLTLPPVTVAVTRAEVAIERLPWAVQTIEPAVAARGRPAWGLDEVLGLVPGVLVANRHNFSVDQRVSIRGFGARSAFAVRGIRVVLDGIPLTLPDGQGQLTTVDLGAVERIEVLRGTASVLQGNAAGGILNITTLRPAAPVALARGRVLAGSFDREFRRVWSKWQVETQFAVGSGYGRISASRLAYDGERDHTAADFQTASGRVVMPLGGAWTLSVLADGGNSPRADNPGALTAAELAADPDSAAALNLLRRAGKAVSQAQSGVALRGQLAGAELSLGAFGLTRALENPLPQALIELDRRAWGARASASRATRLAGRPAAWTVGIDAQWQRDTRREFSYLIPNAALTTPDNTPDTLTRHQLERVSELGPFVQLSFDLTSGVSIMAGLRHDAVGFTVSDRHTSDGADNSGARTYAATSGSAGIALLPGRGVTLYANAGTSFETPTTTELNNQPPPQGGGFNLGLQPQRATSFELGARSASRRFSWSAAAFTADVRDELIAFEDTLVPGRRYFRNAARARHQGLELGASARAAAGVTLVLAWTISDFRYRSHQLGAAILDGRAIPGIPRHSLRTSLRLDPPWSRGIWGVVDVSHASGHFVDDTLDTKTEGWMAVDLRAGWEGTIAGWRIAPFVAIQNLFDRQYVSSVVINAARGRYYEPAPGRNAYFGLELTALKRNVEEKH
jgi:iron complex outermembrane receptor protein